MEENKILTFEFSMIKTSQCYIDMYINKTFTILGAPPLTQPLKSAFLISSLPQGFMNIQRAWKEGKGNLRF